MPWESAGYGMHPFRGNNAPHIDVHFEDGKTIFIVCVTKRMDQPNIELFTHKIFDCGKEILATAEVEQPQEN